MKIRSLFAALTAAALMIGASAYAQGVDPVARGLAGYALSGLEAKASATTIVCSGGGIQNADSAVLQSSSRSVFYCPRGASSVSFMFTGVYSKPSPTYNTAPVPMNLALEATPTPPPWNATTAYAVGATVSYNGGAGNGSNPEWTAVAANTNSPPTPANIANWTPAAAPALIPITCGGVPACGLTAIQTPGGVTLTEGYFITDPVAVNCPVGCYIALRAWTNQSTGQTQPLAGRHSSFLLGSAADFGATRPDPTQSGSTYVAANFLTTAKILPLAVIGAPLKRGPTVCIVGTSIDYGIVGQGVSSTTTVSGGSGYLVNDVLTHIPSGGSSGAVGTPGQLFVNTVSAGAVTATFPINPGSYANPATQPSQTAPTGTQSFSGGSGTGFTATISYNTTALEAGDIYDGGGYVERGLDIAGVPYMWFAVPSDQVNYWLSGGGDYGRSVMAGKIGCSSMIDDEGTNDLGVPENASVLEAAQIKLANLFVAQGVKPFLGTVLPRPTSTDGYLVLSNETVWSDEAQRRLYNTWVRTTPAPFVGYFDAAAAEETSPNSGLLTVDGATICKWTCDGVHPSINGHTLLAPAISSFASLLQ